jgi:hypothetical protein
MDEGEAYLKKSFFNFLAFGWGSTDLVFERTSPKKEIRLMNSWEFSRAYHCSACGATIVATRTGKR